MSRYTYATDKSNSSINFYRSKVMQWQKGMDCLTCQCVRLCFWLCVQKSCPTNNIVVRDEIAKVFSNHNMYYILKISVILNR